MANAPLPTPPIPAPAPAPATRPLRPSRPAIVAVGVVTLVALLVAGAGVVRGIPGPVVRPADPAVVAFAAYLDAIATGDVDGARARLTPVVQRILPEEEFRAIAAEQRGSPQRAWLAADPVVRDEGRVQLSVRFDRVDHPFPITERTTQTVRVSLVASEDGWLIDTPVIGMDRW